MQTRLALMTLIAAASSAAAQPTPHWAAQRLDAAMEAYANGDYRKASKGFIRLADHGSAIGETMLGVMYADGKGVKASAAVAAAYFYRAAGRGYGPAEIALSDAYLTGHGINPDARRAYFWAFAATKGGDRSAEANGRKRLARLQAILRREDIVAIERDYHHWRPRAIRRR